MIARAWLGAALGAGVTFVAIDLLWLGVIAGAFYRRALGHLLLERFNLAAAAVFYPIFLLGLVVLAIAPSVAAESWRRALALGALYGLCTYATYDLTNLATLRGWPVGVVVTDVAWGAALTGVSALAGYAVAMAVR